MTERNTHPDLANYHVGDYTPGRPALVIALWLLVEALFVASWVPGRAHRRLLLRLFGARLGRGVVVKPRVRVKFPWRLQVGDHSWIGEGVWIDNLAEVRIGSNACVSQWAYLCTGSHDWSRTSFDLRTDPISVEDGAWVGARATVGPGVTIGQGAVVALGAVVTQSLAPGVIYRAPTSSGATRTET